MSLIRTMRSRVGAFSLPQANRQAGVMARENHNRGVGVLLDYGSARQGKAVVQQAPAALAVQRNEVDQDGAGRFFGRGSYAG